MFLIGSKLLGLSNNHDTDMLVINKEDSKYYERKLIEDRDTVYRSISNIDRQMNFELPLDSFTAKYYIINYQLDIEIIGQNFPVEYHILDRREDYINLLINIVDNKWCNFNKEVNINNWHMSKLLYHVAYLTFILENNSTVLTVEQKEIVQKIHDKQMPIAYLDILEAKIKNLQ